MTFNGLALPTLAGALLLFCLGWRLSTRAKSSSAVACLTAASTALSVPGLLIAFYYLHFYDSWRLFHEFRAVPGSELTAVGAGLLAGVMAQRAGVFGRVRIVIRAGILAILCLGIAMPYAKPLVVPADYASFRDEWDGAVCKQSTGYSCGAACAATLLRFHGVPATELEIAKECFTYSSGTENWYVARAFRRRGLRVTFITMPDVSDELPTPCIAGVRKGQTGHFITIVEKRSDTYVVGDPLVGQRVHDGATIYKDYSFTGFFMKVEKEG